MRALVPAAATAVMLVLAVGPAQAATTFVQDQRVNSLTLQLGTDTFAAHNAFGGAFVGTTVRSDAQSGLNSGVADGSVSWLLEMRDLTDLSGTNDASFHVGVFNPTPVTPAGNSATYDGTSDLDWWYLPDGSELNTDGSPKQELPASFAAGTFDAGPGAAALRIDLLGTPMTLDLSNLQIQAVAGATSKPTVSTSGDPPGHLPSEYVDPTLASFGSMSQGKLTGDISARSLVDTLVPSSLTDSACSSAYTSSSTILDVLVSGCKNFLTTEVAATQPDRVVAGIGSGTYVFTADSQHHVTSCTHNGSAATLDSCLDGAAYSIYFQFTTDRVIDQLQMADGKLLTAHTAGSGSGLVIDSPTGRIGCGDGENDCTEPYDAGTQVTLDAFPSTGSVFAGWTGCDSPSGATCEMTMDADKQVTANFVQQHTLTVSTAGAGTGSVMSSPAGIRCGATCSAEFADGTPVTLTAAPGVGSGFAGWSGGGCSGTGTCMVTINADTSVTATFVPLRTLTVTKAGSGGGSISSSPGGIACGATCSADYDNGTSVKLTAGPASGSRFSGWSGGGCSGTGTCMVTMNSDASVTATFVARRTLTVTKAGSGSVSSSPAGIDCGATCSASYDEGTSITLTATAASGFHFAGWSGDCTGTGVCTLAMSAAHAATATFGADPKPITRCHVPNVKGKPLAKAKKAIVQAHCGVGKIKRAYSATAKTGRVISQQPGPRKILPNHAKVNLKVSKGRKK